MYSGQNRGYIRRKAMAAGFNEDGPLQKSELPDFYTRGSLRFQDLKSGLPHNELMSQ